MVRLFVKPIAVIFINVEMIKYNIMLIFQDEHTALKQLRLK